MPTHPLWRPFELVDLAEVARVRVGGPSRGVRVVAYDAAWPRDFDRIARRIRTALGDRALTLDHVGSTAVPGLAAKPVIDVDLVVADSADEAAYLPALEAQDFTLRIREPEWDEHRVLHHDDPATNLHVWSPGAREVGRHRMFRDRLRAHPGDRDAYGALKTRLAARDYSEVMDYNNHKAGWVYDLYERIFADDPAHEHDPRPRAEADDVTG